MIAASALGGAVFLIQPRVPLPPPWNVYLPASERAVLALFLAGMIAVKAYAWTSFGRERIVTALCVIAYLSMFFIHVFLMPATNAYHHEQSFARRVMVRLGANDRYLALFQPFGVLGPLFYMAPSHPLPAFYEASQLDAAIAEGRIRWVMVREKDIPAIAIGGKIVDAQRSFPFEDPEERRHRVVLMCVDRSCLGEPVPLRSVSAR
jgi:hypothetical protein